MKTAKILVAYLTFLACGIAVTLAASNSLDFFGISGFIGLAIVLLIIAVVIRLSPGLKILKVLTSYMAFVTSFIVAGVLGLMIYTEYGLFSLIGAALAISAIAGAVFAVAERLQDRYGSSHSTDDSQEFFVEPTVDSDYPPSQFPESRALREANRLPRSRASQ